MEALQLKICYYLNRESHIHLGVLRKTNAKKEQNFGASQSCNMLRLIHMYPAADTNTTSDQRSYLHKNIIFLVIILIIKHALFRLMQKYLIQVISCLLCYRNWYSWGVIRSSRGICTRSHRIRIVVKFYNHTLRIRYGCFPMQYYPPLVLF